MALLETKTSSLAADCKDTERGLSRLHRGMAGGPHGLLMSLTLLLPTLLACDVALPDLSWFCPAVRQYPMMTFHRALIAAVSCQLSS